MEETTEPATLPQAEVPVLPLSSAGNAVESPPADVPPVPGNDGPRLDPPPGPAGPVRKGVLVGLALLGSLLMGLAGARLIADDEDRVDAVTETPTAAPTATATASPTTPPTATATSAVTPTPTRPAGEVPSTGAPTVHIPTRAIDEPTEPPAATATVTPTVAASPGPITPTPGVTATESPTEPPGETATAAPTGGATPQAE